MNSSLLQVCYDKAFDEFPKQPFGVNSNIWDAFVAFIVILILYNYMAIICDDYFLPSIEKCSKVLKLREDIAGATIMAAGSSAAELFINILGAAIGNFDVGLGTVVGSGMINSVVVVGFCGLLSRGIYLQRWPLIRDSVSYSVALVVLFVITVDGVVEISEAVVLFCFYIVNIVIFVYNDFVSSLICGKLHAIGFIQKAEQEQELYLPISSGDTTNTFSFYGLTNILIIRNHAQFSKGTVFRCAANCLILERKYGSNYYQLVAPEKSLISRLWQSLMTLINKPIIIVLELITPNPVGKYFFVVLIMSMAWLGGISYVSYWMVEVICFVFRVNIGLMGLIVLAVGSSIQDTYSSIKVAKEGKGNMAVSNCIGSNIINIEICVSVPWIIRGVITGQPLYISDHNLPICVAFLFIAIWISIFLLKCNNWNLNKSVGCSLLFYYAIFVIVVIVLYYNNSFFCILHRH